MLTQGLGAASAPGMPSAEEDIRGPKALVEIPAPPPPANIALWIGVAIAVLVLAALLYGILRRRRAEVVTPEQRARRDLSQLMREGSGLSAEAFAAAASGILRRYIEARHGFAAPKRTSEEFLQEVLAAPTTVLASQVDALRGFLRACDMAKFAGSDLDTAQREDLIFKARAFFDLQPSTEEAAK